MIYSRKYRGVYFAPRKKHWHGAVARWAAKYRGRVIGYYATERQAALALDLVHYRSGNWSHKPLVTWDSLSQRTRK